MTLPPNALSLKDHLGNEITEADIGDIYVFHKYGGVFRGRDGFYQSKEKFLLIGLGISPVVVRRTATDKEYIDRRNAEFIRLRTNTKVKLRRMVKNLKKVLALPKEIE